MTIADLVDVEIWDTIEEQRTQLCSIAKAYGGAFPGSPGHTKAVAAESLIKQIDANHPEIVAAINAKKLATKNDKSAWV